jgi:hypothetical protein
MASNVNLADRAYRGELTVEEVNVATKEKLETDKYIGYDGELTVLFCVSDKCSIEVVEAIINKVVDVNGLSAVSNCYYYMLFIIS